MFSIAMLLILLTKIFCLSHCYTFSSISTDEKFKSFSFHRHNYATLLFAANEETNTEIPLALPPASETNTPENDPTVPPEENEPIDTINQVSTSASTTLIITNEMKRTLIEELRYTRKDVEEMRVELAAPIISKRIQRPQEGMPAEWRNDDNDKMLQRLKNESKYPLKFPLLGVSLVLFGKGLSDAIVTLIKVQQGFRGASLAEEFMGVPVLGIDAVCVLLGAGLCFWTLQTMRDE